jgi:DNA-binding transcriptional MerR regulator
MEILTKKELSKLLKVTERTIDRLRKEGLPWFYVASDIRFYKEEVLTWLKGGVKC